MRKFFATLMACVFGAFLASCDLQPKITALPDTVGDFISARYPAMLADPDTEPEIYNSAVSDYGVYASPELYGSVDMDDYVNYAAVDDYILKPELEPATSDAPVTENESEPAELVAEPESEPDDILDIPEYKNDELNVPARPVAGSVIVRRGDTLYSIARENNTSVADLARVNNLTAPYTIKIGQTLKLKPESEPVKMPTVEDKKPETVKQPAAKPVEQKPVQKPAEPKKVEQKTVAKPVEKNATEKPKDVRVPLKTVTVARGDTLYSLSRRYEIPVNDLAVMNDLRAPFALNVGQKLRVPDLPEQKAGAPVASSSTKVVTQPKVVSKPADAKPAPAKNATPKGVTEKPKAKPTETVKPVENNINKQNKKTEQKQEKISNQKQQSKTEKQKTTKETKSSGATKSQLVPSRSSSKFTWPVRGTILSHYGAKSGGLYNDGINISAAAGTTVVAAENGVVAYAGNEVKGMGNLIIIQHADGWMTVYAHLNSMATRRGVRVSVGQKIGTVGQTGKVTKPQLHFEIRKGTKSYNPTNYLKK